MKECYTSSAGVLSESSVTRFTYNKDAPAEFSRGVLMMNWLLD